MSTTTHPARKPVHHETAASSREILRQVLLACGVLYSLLYVVANDVVAASLYDGYSRTSQAISELSATGSPAQPFLTALLPLFAGLLMAFGLGVWWSARGDRRTRVVGGLLLAQGITSLLWLFAPMSQRESIAAHGGTTGDVLHLVLSAASLLFIGSEIWVGKAVFGRTFRVYSIASLVAFFASAVAMGVMSPGMAAGEATPWLGLVERVMLGAWLAWMAVLALALMRARSPGS